MGLNARKIVFGGGGGGGGGGMAGERPPSAYVQSEQRLC